MTADPSDELDAVSHHQRMVDGYLVNIMLRPDVANPNLAVRMDPYLEAFHLPFVCSDGENLMCATRQAVRPVAAAGGKILVTGFIYLTAPPVYISYTNDPSRPYDGKSTSLAVLGQDGYLDYAFKYHSSAELVWDIAAEQPSDRLANSLSAGRTHFVVFRDRFGYTRSYPVDIFYMYEAKREFTLITQSIVLPGLFFDPTSFHDILYDQFGGNADLKKQSFGIKAMADQCSTYFSIASDGTVSDLWETEHKSDSLLRVYAYA
jgi:hypothetical protein